MKLWKFGVLITVIYSMIVYYVNVIIGLYAGIIMLVFLIAILPIVTPKEDKMTKKEMEEFGKIIIGS